MLNRDTKLCISIAAKTSNFGASMHNAGYGELGLNFAYLPIKTEDTGGAVAGMRAFGIRGMSVSVPHKQAIMPLLDEIDETAQTIGAVNTVVNNNGRLTGYNYDWVGAVKALEEVTELNSKHVALLGAGGAARAIVYGLQNAGATIDIYNRNVDHGQELAKELGGEYVGDLPVFPTVDYDILINATSIGSQTTDLPIATDKIPAGIVVMDIVPLPVETELLKEAKKKGCKIVAGVRMLIHQAGKQFEDYTGESAPLEVMEQALLKAVEES